MKKNNSLYLSLVSGAVGIMIGAGSMYVGQAGIIQRHSAAQQNVLHETQEQGLKNMNERKAAKRADVVYPTNARP
ncbi:MAG: hypothetical protein HOO67_00475 [Candidatus Peribacteraceae bacterium]|nr:hypothetical protein [Candidatus Peribacteraceae bacterium]